MALGIMLAYVCLAGEVSSTPSKRVFLSTTFAGQLSPLWMNGRLVNREADLYPRVFAYGPEGTLETRADVSIPGASNIMVTWVAAGPDGVLTATGSAITPDGALGMFIALIDKAGNVTRIIRTNPFGVGALCFAADGSLWAAGKENQPDFSTKPGHDVLRHYDQQGRLLGSILPRETFANYKAYLPATAGFLAASSDRIGFYSNAAREFIEVSLQGEVLGRRPGIETADLRTNPVRCFAYTASGTVYAWLKNQTLFTLDRASSKWTQVKVSGSGNFVGAEGNSLVFRGEYELLFFPIN